jgi:hypothetical protein
LEEVRNSCRVPLVGFLPSLFFDPEDGGDMFLRNVDLLSTDYTALHPRRYIGVLISLWLFLFPIFLFAAQPKELFLDGLKKLEQRSHKCVKLWGEYVE